MTTRSFFPPLPDQEDDEMSMTSTKPMTRRSKMSSPPMVEENSKDLMTEKLLMVKKDPVLFKPNYDGNEVVFYLEAIERNGYALVAKDDAHAVEIATIFKMKIIQMDYPYLGHYLQLQFQTENQKIKYFGSNDIVLKIEPLKGKIKYFLAEKERMFMGIIVIS